MTLTGNLTKDPELQTCRVGWRSASFVAVNGTLQKDESGQWVDKPNYFDVTVWGAQGENCANYLSKGRPVAVDGRLDWREWEAQDGSKRQAVEIVADSVQFLGSRDGSGRQDTGSLPRRSPTSPPTPPTHSNSPSRLGRRRLRDDDIPFLI